MRRALGVAQGEVAVGVEQRAQAHRAQILAEPLPLRLLAREDDGAALLPHTERGDEGRLVDGGEPRDGGGQRSRRDGALKRLELGELPHHGVQEFHGVLPFRFFRASAAGRSSR